METTADEKKLDEGVIYLQTRDKEDVAVAVDPEDADPAVTYAHDLLIGGGATIEWMHNGPLVGRYVDLAPIKLSKLRSALKFKRCCNDASVYIERGAGQINEDMLDLDDLHLELREEQLVAVIRTNHENQPEMTEKEYESSLQQIMAHYGCDVFSVRYLSADLAPISTLKFDYSDLGLDPDVAAKAAAEEDERIRNTVHVVEVLLTASDEDPCDKLIDAGRALTAYLNALKGDTLTARTIVDLLRGGHTKLLLGHKESAFLDVKSQQYNVGLNGDAGNRQKIELAQDVARFANGDQDAVLVLGYTEAKVGQDSVIKAVKEIDLEGFDPDTYLKILDAKVVPAVTGLRVESVETEPGKGIIFIYVPAQAPEMQPYLVHGVVAEGKVEGAFFSIVQRRGEGSIAISASQIHGYLVAGKAFLRGES